MQTDNGRRRVTIMTSRSLQLLNVICWCRDNLPRVAHLGFKGGQINVHSSCITWEQSSVCLSGTINQDTEEGQATEAVLRTCHAEPCHQFCLMPPAASSAQEKSQRQSSVKQYAFCKYDFLERTWRPLSGDFKEVLKIWIRWVVLFISSYAYIVLGPGPEISRLPIYETVGRLYNSWLLREDTLP